MTETPATVPNLAFLAAVARGEVRIHLRHVPDKGSVFETSGALPVVSRWHHEAGYVSDPSFEKRAGYSDCERPNGAPVRLTEKGVEALARLPPQADRPA